MKRSSKIVVASAVLALPFGTAALKAQERPQAVTPIDGGTIKHSCCFKQTIRREKWPAGTHIVGLDNGAALYQNERGQHFYLNPATGDMVFIGEDAFAKYSAQSYRSRPGTPLRMIKWAFEKYPAAVTPIGLDRAGHVIHQNERGETFYLDPLTADMVFVK